MKISPINQNFNIEYVSLLRLQDRGKTLPVREETPLSNAFYPPLNFKGVAPLTFTKELQSLKNVHCPCCGTKMLTREELTAVLAEIAELKTSANLVGFLKKHIESINPVFYKFIDEINSVVAKEPEVPSEELLERVKQVACADSDKSIEKLVQTISDTIATGRYSGALNQHLGHAIKRINSLPTDVSRINYYPAICKILKNDLSDFIPRENKELYRVFTEIIREPLVKEMVFTPAYREQTPMMRVFCENLMHQAKSSVKKVFYYEAGNTENLYLACTHCERSGINLMQHIDKENYYQYVYEMAQRVLDGEITSAKDYPLLLLDYVKQHTYYRLSPDVFQPALKALYKELDFKQQREHLLGLVEENGVPCAYCGQKTINHETKVALYDEIIKAQSLQEVVAVLNNNEHIIKPHYKILVDLFNSKLKETPDITEEHLLYDMRKYLWDELKNKIREGLQDMEGLKYQFHLSYVEQNVIKNVETLIEKVLSTPTNYDYSFDYLEYRDNLIALTKPIERSQVQFNIIKTCFKSIQSTYYPHYNLYPHKAAVQRVGSTVKVVAQNIFSRGQATVEHLDPISKYMDRSERRALPQEHFVNDASNLVVACKDCNTRKKSKDLKIFVKSEPDRVFYFWNYLKAALEIQKQKPELKDSYNVQKVVEKFEKLTGLTLPPLNEL